MPSSEAQTSGSADRTVAPVRSRSAWTGSTGVDMKTTVVEHVFDRREDRVRLRTSPIRQVRAGSQEIVSRRRGTIGRMATIDTDAMIARFKQRAVAVKQRPLPPVAGEERQQFINQAKIDYQDFAIIGDATASIDGGILTFRVDLRPEAERD